MRQPARQQIVYLVDQYCLGPDNRTGTIGAHREAEGKFQQYEERRFQQVTMVSTRNNANNDRVVEGQATMIQTLQAQMEDLRRKGVAD